MEQENPSWAMDTPEPTQLVEVRIDAAQPWVIFWQTPDGIYHCPLGSMRPLPDGTWEMTHKYPEAAGWMEAGA